MTLTKQEAIENHRKMWNWIADELEKGNGDKYHIIGLEFLQAEKIKLAYFTEICELKEKDFPGGLCYCCEYRNKHAEKPYSLNGCRKCPIEWPGGCCHRDKDYDYETTPLYSKFCTCFARANFQKATKLARQIANLPENPNS